MERSTICCVEAPTIQPRSSVLPCLLKRFRFGQTLTACTTTTHVWLKNTLDPKAAGTIIDNVIMRGKIKAVAAKDNITAIKIKSSRMLLATGFLRKVFEIFESYQTPIDMIATSEVGVSMSIDNSTQAMQNIPVRMISYGGSNYNISFLIKGSDKKRALQCLSEKLFSER